MQWLKGSYVGKTNEHHGQAESSLSKWFTEIKEWNSKLANRERHVWLSYVGVLAHAWREEVLRTIAQFFGSYVGVDDSTRVKRRMDVGRVLCNTTSPEVVNRTMNIKITSELFVVRVMEEPFAEDYVYLKSSHILCNSEDS